MLQGFQTLSENYLFFWINKTSLWTHLFCLLPLLVPVWGPVVHLQFCCFTLSIQWKIGLSEKKVFDAFPISLYCHMFILSEQMVVIPDNSTAPLAFFWVHHALFVYTTLRFLLKLMIPVSVAASGSSPGIRRRCCFLVCESSEKASGSLSDSNQKQKWKAETKSMKLDDWVCNGNSANTDRTIRTWLIMDGFCSNNKRCTSR